MPRPRSSASRSRRPPKAPPNRTASLVIEGLGADGDGLAKLEDKPVYVAGALPGEQVTASLTGDHGVATAIDTPSPDRVTPLCRHAGQCGGCRLQHLAPPAYESFKRRRVLDALSRAGLEGISVEPLIPAAAGSRRRATLAFRAEGKRVRLGYHRLRSHEIIAVETCPLIDPSLVALLDPLTRILAELFLPADRRVTGSVHLTALSDGVTATLTAPVPPTLDQRQELAVFAADQALAGLWWREEGATFADPISVLDRGVVRPGGIAIRPDPTGFLQATDAGEAALVAQVLAAAKTAPPGRALDLYCGIGTFALPLAASGRMVDAVEGEASALEALDIAARGAVLAPRITAEKRNLAKDPLTADEIKGAAFAVFDPPRAGAAAQAAILAESTIPVIVAVSCNPATFARDLKRLVSGGYRVDAVTPIDQFLWSGHVECVAILRRHA